MTAYANDNRPPAVRHTAQRRADAVAAPVVELREYKIARDADAPARLVHYLLDFAPRG